VRVIYINLAFVKNLWDRAFLLIFNMHLLRFYSFEYCVFYIPFFLQFESFASEIVYLFPGILHQQPESTFLAGIHLIYMAVVWSNGRETIVVMEMQQGWQTNRVLLFYRARFALLHGWVLFFQFIFDEIGEGHFFGFPHIFSAHPIINSKIVIFIFLLINSINNL